MPISQAEFESIRKLVHERSAIVLDQDKVYLGETRLLPVAQREGLPSVSALVSRLSERAAGLDQKVVEAMTTNETFFRDVQPFEALRQVVFPELQRCRATERKLTVWSAACASGQEAYSIALLLREHLCLPSSWEVRLLASDLSQAMLDRARAGRYSQAEVNRGLPAAMLVKYFQRQGLEWELREDLRRMVQFLRINLIDPWPELPPLDVVFLRNVLIYFDLPTRKAVLNRLRRVLRPDGYLFLGGAETLCNLDDGFERVPFERAGCYRVRRS